MHPQEPRVVTGVGVGVGLHRRDQARDDGARIVGPHRVPPIGRRVIGVKDHERAARLGGDRVQVALEAVVALRI